MPPEQGAPLEEGPAGAQWLGTLPGGASPAAAPPESNPGPILAEASPGPILAEASPGPILAEASPAAASVGASPVAAPVEASPAAAPAEASPAAVPGEAAGTGRSDPVAWLIALAAFAAYTTISVFGYLRLDPGSWDLGIYTQYVWQIAHLHAPVVAIRAPGFDLLGDHFQPIVALVAPFFRLFPTPVTLLVAQAALTAVSVVPVCRAARVRLGTGVSRVIGAAYVFSWGLQQMIIFDFHEIAFAVPLLACSLSALLRRRLRAAVAWALPLVFVKEDQGLTVAAIGLVMIGVAIGIQARRGWDGGAGDTAGLGDGAGLGDRAGAGVWARAGAVLVLWGLAWSVLAITVIIPHFDPAHHYAYWSDGGVIAPGGHLSAGGLLAQFTRAGPEKLRTTALVLLPVAFLALRSPLATVAVPGLALRFLSTNSSFWGTQWHYSATLMPIAFVAAIDGLARIEAGAARRRATRSQGQAARSQRTQAARYAAVAMAGIAAVLAFRFPLAGLWNPGTYEISPQVRAEREAIAVVPAGTTVESTLTMLAPLAARDVTFWIGTTGNPVPRYIVYDAASSGYAHPPTDILGFFDTRYPGVSYQAIFKADDVYVFRRITNPPGPS
jgi:uncharacterized membrane protein